MLFLHDYSLLMLCLVIISFLKTFGKLPTQKIDEQVRLQTHLAYVENLLRSANTQHLSTTQKIKRAYLLDKLHEYWVAGQFPKNLDYPNERRPCFVDKFGNICAVGYLVAVDVGREIAEYINAQAKYAYLHEMQIAILDVWIEQSGLSKLECAMIQPGYQRYVPDYIFTIKSMTPTSTSANGRVFDMKFVVDGIPTTATATTNPFSIYSFGAALLPLGVSIDVLESFNQYFVRLKPVNLYLTNSKKYPGRTQGTLVFQVNGANLRVMPHQVLVFYTEPPPRGLGIYFQNNYYTAQPDKLDVQPGTSGVQQSSDSEILAFPNPAASKFEIRSKDKILKLRLLAIDGTEVLTKQNFLNENLDMIEISSLPKGVYFLEAHYNSSVKIQKLVKQ